jgi:hypothetical protein
MSELRRLPGASYRGSNAFVIARRKLLNLEEPFRMTFDAWRRGNHLYDWYTARLSNPFIQTMQLRKERESPFFHEFIVIRLKSGTYWRIDRRQLPNEVTPLDSLYEGVPAHDTVEQVTALESGLYARSDCLIELEFSTDVHLALVLRICRTIQNHERARVYTIQRYNCYFFAQALIFCTACGVSDWAGVGEQVSCCYVYMFNMYLSHVEGRTSRAQRPLEDPELSCGRLFQSLQFGKSRLLKGVQVESKRELRS